jgi:hypothetical protein
MGFWSKLFGEDESIQNELYRTRVSNLPRAMRYLYHYCERRTCDAILDNPIGWFDWITRSVPRTPRGIMLPAETALYGDGYYFTDIRPGTCPRTRVEWELWGTEGENYHKTGYAIEAKFHGNTHIILCREHVLLVPLITRARPILRGIRVR